jgi:1-acyl-sn-glycerol-3-phosphate acyltransferase
MKPFYWLVRAIIRALGRLLFRLEAKGVENIPHKGGCLLVANHASNLDPPLIAVSVPRICNTLAKRELFDLPLLGWAIRNLFAYPIERGGVDRKALRQCVEALRSGEILLLFPEGTRTFDGELQQAKAGAAMIAMQAGVPILPVYIEGTYDALPRGRSWPKFTKVRVHFGEPFLPDELIAGTEDKRAAYSLLAAEMMRRIADLASKAKTA